MHYIAARITGRVSPGERKKSAVVPLLLFSAAVKDSSAYEKMKTLWKRKNKHAASMLVNYIICSLAFIEISLHSPFNLNLLGPKSHPIYICIYIPQYCV